MADLPETGVRPHEEPPVARPAAAQYARLTSVSGVVFAVLLVAGLVLVHRSPAMGVSDSGYAAFYRDGGKTVLVSVGLYLVPFAGIAFLWHMTTVRLLVTSSTPSPSAVPFGLQALSGALFVGLLFAGTGAAGAVALVQDLTDGPLPAADVGRSLTGLGYALVFVYATRAAGMYAITTSTLLRNAGLIPRWAALLSYLMATVMLVATTFNPTVLLVFPGWVALVAAIVVVRTGRSGDGISGRSRT
jgi:hypothetical protein